MNYKPHRSEQLQEIASRQEGYFTAKQAIECGFPKNVHTYQSKRDNWQRVAKGLYSLPGYAQSNRSEWVRWLLWSRNNNEEIQGALCKESALEYYGLLENGEQVTHMSVPHDLRKRGADEKVLRLYHQPEQPVHNEGVLRVVSLERTLEECREKLQELGQYEKVREQVYSSEVFASYLSTQEIGAAKWSLNVEGILPDNILMDEAGMDNRELSYLRTSKPNAWQRASRLRGFEEAGRPASSFTLIEMLVVVAIIGILAGMLMPSMRKAIDSTYLISCQNNFRQLGIGWQQWMSDNNNKILPSSSGTSSPGNYPFNYRGIDIKINEFMPGNASTGGVVWVALLQNYLNMGKLGNTSHNMSSYWTLSDVDRFFTCPSSEKVMKYLGSVQMGMNKYNISGWGAWGAKAVTHVTDFNSPSRKVIFVDSARGGTGNMPGSYEVYSSATSDNTTQSSVIDFERHNGQTNSMMADNSMRVWSADEHAAEVMTDFWKSEPWAYGKQKGSKW